MADAPTTGGMDYLHKQVGPLPVGGWLLVVGASMAFAYWRKRNAPTSTNTSSDQLQPLMTDQTLGNIGGMLALLNKGQTGVTTAGTTDNVSWYRDAVNKLLAKGYATGLVDDALRKYMQGMSLSKEEEAVRDLALQLAGPLPYPPPPPTTTPTTPKNFQEFTAGSANPLLEPVTHQKAMIPLYGGLNPSVPGASIIGYVPFGTELQSTGPNVKQLWSTYPGQSNNQNTLMPVTYNGQTGYVAQSDVMFGQIVH